jgi:hypothetical protein
VRDVADITQLASEPISTEGFKLITKFAVMRLLVETWVNGHVLGADSEPLTVLVLIFYVKHEWDARGVLGHHFLDEAHRQVHALDNQRLVALVALVDDFGQFFCHKCALFFVALESDLLL